MAAQQLLSTVLRWFAKCFRGHGREGGEDIMHMEKPELKRITGDPNLKGSCPGHLRR